MEKEVWKDIEEYEGYYQVSNLGRVKSVSKFHKTDKNYSSIGYFSKEKILKPFFDRPKGYLSVSLSKNNKIKIQRIHRLVAKAFIPNPNNLKQINHKSGIKTENFVENLEWCSCKDNIKHAWENKLSYVSEKHRKVASETQKKRWEEYRKNKLANDRLGSEIE